MKNFKLLLLIVVVFLSISSCKKSNQTPNEEEAVNEPTPTPNNFKKIGETYIVGAKAKATIYSPKDLETGYNEIYIALNDSIDGTSLTNGTLSLTPLMNMGSMTHGCPVENPVGNSAVDGYFKAAVIFSMPGSSSEWSLKLNFLNNKNGLSGNGSININVALSSPAKFKSTTLALDSSKKVFISLIEPTAPKVGINNFEIVLHQKYNSNYYPAINNYSIEIIPEMPSMNHGSPNNVNPVNVGNGHYKGKVNYTMTGLWYVRLKIYKNGSVISSDQYFEMTLN
ncbi:MAG: FixH family protein [Bacteroidetes bacterium]|nr:FixH family protein [Bacteroidota bacterium]